MNFQGLFAEYTRDALDHCAQQAREYLEAHPDEPGVLVTPEVTTAGQKVELRPVKYTREDVGL